MKRALFALSLVAMLAGCGGGPYMIGNVCVGIACTDYHVSDLSMFGSGQAEAPRGQFDRPILDPVGRLKRNDPDEKPAMIAVRTGPDTSIQVAVYAENCPPGETMPGTVRATRTIYLCGTKIAFGHEKAHLEGPNGEGMEHGSWYDTGVAKCALVLREDWGGIYKKGTTICAPKNGAYEFVDRGAK